MPVRGLALIVTGRLRAPARSRTPRRPRRASPRLKTKKGLVRAFYAVAESGDVEDFANVLGPDRVDHGPVGIEPDERAGSAKGTTGWVSE